MASDNQLTGHDPDGSMEQERPYEYQEYPKVIYRDGENPVTVQNEAEERALLGEPAPDATADETDESASSEAHPDENLTKGELIEKYGLDLEPGKVKKEDLLIVIEELKEVEDDPTGSD